MVFLFLMWSSPSVIQGTPFRQHRWACFYFYLTPSFNITPHVRLPPPVWSTQLIFLRFIFDRETGWGRGRERETQNPKQAPGSKLSAEQWRGVRSRELQDHDLSRSRMPNRLSHPGSLKFQLLLLAFKGIFLGCGLRAPWKTSQWGAQVQMEGKMWHGVRQGEAGSQKMALIVLNLPGSWACPFWFRNLTLLGLESDLLAPTNL